MSNFKGVLICTELDGSFEYKTVKAGESVAFEVNIIVERAE